ncbi:tenascin-X-like [Microplitis mediator]|uniref:tenascin-X-like n=1 Tax=Microplitis mediator TaxID=375433 RepID=UPI002555143E|nr:tenascin-X-like [Microplitis mediator]
MSRFLLISLVFAATLIISIDATCQPRCHGRNEQWYPCGACDSKCGIKVSCLTVCRKGSCGCKPGYVRNSYGTCMLEKYCPKTPRCGKNEELKMCGACDSTCREEMACTRECRLPECGCKKGYVRSDYGECILRCDCPKYPTCGKNEEVKICGACDNTCQGNMSCTLDCRPPECGCKKGYVRSDYGECILPSDCPKYPTCGKNEEVKICGACDNTCQGNVSCTLDCRPPECGCKKGYVRSDYGECILPSDCPKYPTCGKNEEVKICGACDNTCQGNVSCTLDCRPPECGCKKGYVRSDYGECILPSDCPKYPTCGKNEEVKICGACDSTCEGDVACTRECRPPECGCKKGYVRNDYGECILKGDCPKYPTCGKNEEVKICGACDNTCQRNVSCTLACRSPECGCKDGYVRNDGKCILPCDCPKYPTCGENEELKMCGACDSTCTVQKKCSKECRHPECGCKDGYVRSNNGKCIPKCDCPKLPTCGENEEIKMCGACDNTCKGNVSCTLACRTPECGCKKGYVRNNGKCILPCDCPKYPTCGENEELKKCGACDSTCTAQGKCSRECRHPECGCKDGYVRSNNGKCIPKCDCPKLPTCGENEEIKMCGACDSTCDGDKACKLACRHPECGCKKGYVRSKCGKCIRKCDCSKPCSC